MIKKKIYNNLTKFEFIRYILVGGLATMLDWSIFYIFALILGIYYQFALIISFSIATITHYTLSKMFTFKCKSKKIITQFSLFLIIAIISLFLNMFIMFILVDIILIGKMISRILTTAVFLMINYLMHKYITFNKRFFKQK